MKIDIEYWVKRSFQHQSGALWAVIAIRAMRDGEAHDFEASFPLENLERMVQYYVRTVFSAEGMDAKNPQKTSVEI